MRNAALTLGIIGGIIGMFVGFFSFGYVEFIRWFVMVLSLVFSATRNQIAPPAASAARIVITTKSSIIEKPALSRASLPPWFPVILRILSSPRSRGIS